MVSNTSITFMILSLVISFLFPIILFVYFYKKEKITIKPVLIGILIFIVFTQILEKLLHLYVFKTNPMGLLQKPISLAIYGALAAGIFEEVGRFIGFRYLLKNNREWKDGIAYGIGHGGVESILIGGVMSIQYIIFSELINSGLFEQTLSGKIPIDTMLQLKNTLIDTPYYLFGVGGVERVLALIAQVALSLLVLYGVRNRRYIYIVLAIIIHALFDLAAGLYQILKINIWLAEGIILVFSLIALVCLIKSKKIFDSQENKAR